jgi:hypothetical protein
VENIARAQIKLWTLKSGIRARALAPDLRITSAQVGPPRAAGRSSSAGVAREPELRPRGGGDRLISDCHLAVLLDRFIPNLLTVSVELLS